jgi:hypothetical protein
MKKITGLLLLLLCCIIATSQPGKIVKKIATPDPFKDSLGLIMKHSANGFINFRYNETQGNASITYTTILPSLGFEKKFVQVGQVVPYKKQAGITLPYFIATRGYTDATAANQFFSDIKRKIISTVKPFAQDSASKTGFARYASFQVSKPVKDSFVTIELILLADPKGSTSIMRLFNSKGSIEKGIMKNPPVVVNTNKNHYTGVLQLIQALMGYSQNNFKNITGTLLQNEQWKPTYTSIVSFRDFGISKIEYVTNNLWNQYTTNIFINDKGVAEKRFQDLINEVELCKQAFPTQRYETRSTANEKWWYYDKQWQDVDGKNYKNTLRISLEKFKYGDGYYLTFEFRKSAG